MNRIVEKLGKSRLKCFSPAMYVFPDRRIGQSDSGVFCADGFGKMPDHVLSYAQEILGLLSFQKEIETGPIARVDILLDSEGVPRHIETDFRPYGLGILNAVSSLCSSCFDLIEWVKDTSAYDLQNAVVLYSAENDLNKGHHRSDDYLYCLEEILWTAPLADVESFLRSCEKGGNPIIVRSNPGERIPSWICSGVVHGELNLVMPLFETRKDVLYSLLGQPYKSLPCDVCCDTDETFVQCMRRLCGEWMDEFDTSALVCKPVQGSMSSGVSCITPEYLSSLKGKSKLIKRIRRGGQYVVQPMYETLYGVHHQYRLYFFRDAGDAYVFAAALLQFSPSWPVAGGRRVEQFLLRSRDS